MEELLELKEYLLTGDLDKALELTLYLEEMSRDDKINAIVSFCVVLLVHLLKRAVEKRTTRSWDLSIYNACREIRRRNKRRKAGGYYLTSEELAECLEEAYPDAVRKAATEIFEGQLSTNELFERVEPSKKELLLEALDKVNRLD